MPKTNVDNSLPVPVPVSLGGTGSTTAFTAGSVVFAGASGVYSQDNANFFWDDSNNRMGLGTAAPGRMLHVAPAEAPAARIGAGGTDYRIEMVAGGSVRGGYGVLSNPNQLGLFDAAGNPRVLFSLGHAAEQTLASAATASRTSTFPDASGTLPVLSGALVAGSVVFAGAAATLTQDNSNLFWDDLNNRLGVGTAVPGFDLHVFRSTTAATIYLESTPAGGQADLTVINDGGKYVTVQSDGSLKTGNLFGLPRTDMAMVVSVGTHSVFVAGTVGAVPLLLATNNLERARFLSSGEFLLNKTAQTNGGQFEVAGKAYVSGELELDGALNHDGSTAGFYTATPVVQGAAVADASGGVVVDAEARTAVNALLARIRSVGLIAT